MTTIPARSISTFQPDPNVPENKPSTNGMPRLTVTTMKMVSESCP